MLRILAGTLLSGTLLSGPASASSILVLPPMGAEAGPSVLVIEEGREIAPVDPTVTAAYGQEPAVIEAPRYVAVSRSISAMVPAADPESSSVAAIGESGPEERETRPQRQARQVAPMVIRGGLVGEAFPTPRAASAPSRAQQPTSQGVPSAAPSAAPDSGRSQPSNWQEAPADPPSSAMPM